jgi:hypothetical protein
MEKFVIGQNIARFRSMPENETDPKRRTMLQTLLAEQQAKLKSLAELKEGDASKSLQPGKASRDDPASHG